MQNTGSFLVHTNTTNNATTWNVNNHHGQESTKDVMINMLLLMTTVAVVAFICYLIRYIMRDDPSPVEVAAAVSSEHEKRAAFIKENLLVHEWVDDDQENDNNVEDANGKEKREKSTKENVAIQRSGNNDDMTPKVRPEVSKDGNDDNDACSTDSLGSSFEGCAICLADYSPHQTICESSNPACKHVFHEECMVNWLMNHHQCPICQQLYIAQLP